MGRETYDGPDDADASPGPVGLSRGTGRDYSSSRPSTRAGGLVASTAVNADWMS